MLFVFIIVCDNNHLNEFVIIALKLRQKRDWFIGTFNPSFYFRRYRRMNFQILPNNVMQRDV